MCMLAWAEAIATPSGALVQGAAMRQRYPCASLGATCAGEYTPPVRLRLAEAPSGSGRQLMEAMGQGSEVGLRSTSRADGGALTPAFPDSASHLTVLSGEGAGSREHGTFGG